MRCCLHYSPERGRGDNCLVYVHSLRADGKEGIPILPLVEGQIDLLTYDCVGSGQSEGQFSTFGLRESDDLSTILKVLHSQLGYKRFGLWGRNTGAAAVLGCLASKPQNIDVICAVLDSPYEDSYSFVF